MNESEKEIRTSLKVILILQSIFILLGYYCVLIQKLTIVLFAFIAIIALQVGLCFTIVVLIRYYKDEIEYINEKGKFKKWN